MDNPHVQSRLAKVCQRSECERHVFMWFGPNGLTRSTDLPATIVNQVCGQPGDSGAPVTVNNRLVGHDPRSLHRGPAHLHRLVHSVAHPGGDDVDERGNRRRHQPKPARLRLRADRDRDLGVE